MGRLFGVLAAAAAFAVPSASAVTPAAFNDPAGDANGAPDIVAVNVVNSTTGTYGMEVRLATDYTKTSEFWLYLDTDEDETTGKETAGGADYMIYEDAGERIVGLYAWRDAKWQYVDLSAGLTFVVGQDLRTIVLTFDKSLIDDSKAIAFFLVVADAAVSDNAYDDAPSDTGMWDYAFQSGELKLQPVSVKSSLNKHAHTWTVSMSALRSDNDEYVGPDGSILCSATAGKAKLHATQKAFVSPGGGSSSTAQCTFKLPKGHAKLSASLTIKLGSATVTRTFKANS